MASTFDYAYIQEYDTFLNESFQQKQSRLLPTITLDTMAGVNKYYERFGALAAPQAIASRFAPVQPEDVALSRRIVTPISYEKVALVDDVDKIRMAIDPAGEIIQSQRMAFERLFDDVIIAQAIGTANTQNTVNGVITPVSFLSGNIVSVAYDEPGTGQSGQTGLTVGKLKYAKQLLLQKEAVDQGEELFCIVNEAQINQLLRDPQVTNVFYQDAKPLTSGELQARFLGLTFIRSERIPNSSSVVNTAPFPTALIYPKSAIKYTWLKPLHGRIDLRPDLQDEVWQLKAGASFSAVRMWEEKVVQILTDPTQ